MSINPVAWTYPGAVAGGDPTAHPYDTRAQHSLSSPFDINIPGNAAAGPGAYSDNMWYQWETLKDPAIQMVLQERYQTLSLYKNFVPTVVAMRNANGSVPESMTIKGIFSMEPGGIEPIGMRQIWLTGNYTDTYSQSISFEHYGDKVTAHKYDNMVQAYLFRGAPGLIPIARTLLSESVTITLDTQARNAFLSGPRYHYSDPNNVTNFGGISYAGNKGLYDLSENRDLWMDLTYEDVPLAQSPLGDSVGTMICITTPSVVRQIIDLAHTGNGEWVDVNRYARPEVRLKYEVGMYENVRFIAARRNVLWNTGTIVAQFATAEDYGPGDGAYGGLIDNTYQVGQPVSAGVTNYIELSSITGAVTDLKVNDMITIHQRTVGSTAPASGKGVANGVDYKEGTARLRRIVNIDAANSRISLDKPLFHEFPAGSFVTKAEHIHPSTYIAGGEGVINAVADPISTNAPGPIDDLGAIYRFSWDGYYKHQVFRPEVFRINFSAGRTPRWGAGVAP